jgi:hypothetical protein
MTDDEGEQEQETEGREEAQQEDEDWEDYSWPVKGPATPRQALVAIGFIFVLGLVIGFVLARSF